MPDSLQFDRFQLLPGKRQLLVDGAPAELGARALDLLCVLVERAGQLVSKNELLDRVWPDVFVEEANLHVQVSSLRKVLGRDAIATVPGRGYQFVRPVQALQRTDAQTASPAARHAQSPSALPVLLGRDAELQRLRGLVEQERLVTITGAGGSGKTLLARHLLQALKDSQPEGAVWVELLDVTGPAAVPAAVAAALGFESVGGSAKALALALGGSDRLLVLDNAEHVLSAVVDLVQTVREVAPDVRFVVTSQAPLKVAGEQRMPLAGLAVPAWPCSAEAACSSAAVALFVDRARQVDRRFRLDDANVGDVVALCAALDGSALGVQLAASLLGMQPLAEVRRRLVRERSVADPTALGSGDNVLRAALAWSHGLLDDPARRVFRRLAVALGSLPLFLVAAVAGDDRLDATAVADALSDLVDRSLVVIEEPGGDASPRYRLLETPRALALEELNASGETQQGRDRLAGAIAALARSTLNGWFPGETVEAMVPNLADWPAAADVQAALHWQLGQDVQAAAAIGLTRQCLNLPAAERMFFATRMVELSHRADLSPRVLGDVLMAAAALTKHSDLGRRFDLFQQAAEHYANVGLGSRQYRALCSAAEAAAIGRKPEKAQAALGLARGIEDPTWPMALRALFVVVEAAVLSARNDVEAAVPAWRRALELERATRGPAVSTLTSLADAELTVGLLDAAEQHLREAAEVAERRGKVTDRWTFILANLTAARLMQGDLAGARASAAEGWPHARRLDADAWWADHLALLAAREGRPRTAALLLGLADAAYARIKDGRHQLEDRHAREAADAARTALGDASFEALRRAGGTAELEARIHQDALAATDATWA